MPAAHHHIFIKQKRLQYSSLQWKLLQQNRAVLNRARLSYLHRSPSSKPSLQPSVCCHWRFYLPRVWNNSRHMTDICYSSLHGCEFLIELRFQNIWWPNRIYILISINGFYSKNMFYIPSLYHISYRKKSLSYLRKFQVTKFASATNCYPKVTPRVQEAHHALPMLSGRAQSSFPKAEVHQCFCSSCATIESCQAFWAEGREERANHVALQLIY